MKIALVVPGDYYSVTKKRVFSEVANYTKGLAEALKKVGHSVNVLAAGGSDVVLPSLSPLEFSWEVHKWLLANPQDVVEAHQTGFPLVIEQLVGGTPTVIRLTSDLMDIVGIGIDSISDRQVKWSEFLLERICITNAEKVLISEDSYDSKKEITFPDRSVAIVPVGVEEVPVFDLQTPENYVIILLGDLAKYGNGKEFLPEIISNLDADTEVHIVLNCSENMKSILASRIKEKHTSLIFWHNTPIAPQEMEDIYKGAMATIVPSKLGNCYGLFLEPMMYRCPVVTFDYLPSWPLWRLGPWEHPESFCNLKQVLSKISEIPNLERDNYRQFALEYSWDNLVKRYERVYCSAIATSMRKGRIRSW